MNEIASKTCPNSRTASQRHVWKGGEVCHNCGRAKPKPDLFGGYKQYEGERGNPEQWRAAFQFRMGIDTAKLVIADASPRGILGVPRDCMDWASIKSAYRKLVMQTHPDVGGSAEQFKRVQAAYEILEAELQ